MRQLVENANDAKLRRIEKSLLALPPLKLRGIDQSTFSKRRSKRKLLLDLINLVKEADTLYVSNGELQCDHYLHSLRSQGDLFRIMRYYCPEISFKEFREHLFSALNQGIIYINYCSTINKRVIHKYHKSHTPRCLHYFHVFTAPGVIDEFGLTLKIIENG